MSSNRESWREIAQGAGFRWEAAVFLAMWEAVEAQFGRDIARETAIRAIEQAGIKLGQLMAKAYDSNDLPALKEVWETLYPPSDGGNEWDGSTFTVRGNQCFIKSTYDQLDIAEDLRSELYAIFCNGDQAFVKGFNPDIRFAWGGRVMRGDPDCVWIMKDPRTEDTGADESKKE